MTEVPRYVLDASVGLKWLLRLDDEPHQEVADQVLRDYAAARIELMILSHTPYEMAHALTRAVRRERITQEQASTAIRTFDEWSIPRAQDYQHFRLRGLELALNYGCGLYDGTYLALAEMLGRPLVHAD